MPILVTPPGIVIEVRRLQHENASIPMLVTLLGIVIEVRPEQPANVSFPIVVTLLGSVIEVRYEQLSYLQPIITQYFIDNKSEIWLLFLIAHSKR